MKRYALTMVVFLLGISTNFCLGFTIGISNVRSGGMEWQLGVGSYFEKMRSILSEKYTLQILNNYSPATLALCDAIIVEQAIWGDESFTAQEINNIHAFVNSGKGLLAIAEGGVNSDYTASNFNSLLLPYGVKVNSSATMGSGLTVSGFVSHPITDGISEVEIDYHRYLASIVDPAVDLTIGSGEDNILAVVNGVNGAGNVVMLSDSGIFGYPGNDTSIYQHDNLKLLMNISDYIVPEPATLFLLALGAICGRRKRRT